ncbi:MAG: 50S ribosomal protein L13 [Rickettsiales bacterium]|nr:50S ribosomal protein L13 [Rickettsiales bacterium]
MKNKATKTFTPASVKRNWHLVDATDLVAGRLASEVAKLLRGKNKPTYTPNQDVGDYVVVINAEKVCLKGNNKLRDKTYYRHTGFAGGIKETTPFKVLAGKKPEFIIEKAVQRMISREDVLGRAQFNKLFVYAGSNHPHQAQNPIPYDIASLNEKNKRFRTK